MNEAENPFGWPDIEPAPALAVGTWEGEGDILPHGSQVEVLAVDGGARLGREGRLQGVPARTACWIRYWPGAREYAQYRSCDLADLNLSEADWDKLYAMTIAPDHYPAIDRIKLGVQDGRE